MIEEYLDELHARGLCEESINIYKQVLSDLETVAPLETYTKECLIKYFKNLKTKSRFGEPRRPLDSTLQLKQKLCAKFFKDIGKSEVVAWIKHKKLPEKLKDTDILTDSEVALLIETAHSHYSKALLAFLYDTGCRISEAMALVYADLHQDGNNVIVHIPTTKTCAGYRKTVLTYSDILIRNLETYTERRATDKIFCMSYSQNSKIIRDVAAECGIEKKVTAHMLRHAHTMELVRNGTQEAIIRKELGWAPNSPMIARYQHLNDDDVIKSKLAKAGKTQTPAIPVETKPQQPVNIITASKKLDSVTKENELLKKNYDELKARTDRLEVYLMSLEYWDVKE